MRLGRCFLLLCCFLLFSCALRAQSIVFSDTVTPLTVQSHSQLQGRNFYIAPIVSPGNYYLIITATAATTAYVQVPGYPATPVAVSAINSAQYAISVQGLIFTSDVIENKAVHVWCNDADLTVTFLPSQQSAHYTDGTNIPPVTAWDTSYVVVSGPRECRSSYMTVVASADSTIVQINPTCDVALSTPSTFKLSQEKNKPFTRMLMRGQAIQFWTYTDTSFSGTQVRSNKPVGVMAGSSYADATNIPQAESMISPRAWGKTYYTARYGHTSVAIVASKDTQFVRRYDRFQGGKIGEWSLAKAGDMQWVDLIDSGSRWESDAPFMMVLYSTAFGGPSTILQPLEAWKRTAPFNTPTNYAPTINVFVNRNAGYATLDGHDFRNEWHVRIDSNYDCYTFVVYSVSGAGAHELRSDSAIGAYITSTSQYTSSAFAYWSYNGPIDNGAQDTATPTLTFDTSHYCTSVHIADHASRIGSLLFGQPINFNVMKDSLSVIGRDSTDLSICLIDSLEPASFDLTVFNNAGNRQHYSVSYMPNPRFFHPGCTADLIGLDSCLVGNIEDFKVTLTDTSLMRVEIDNIWTDNPNFIFDRTSRAENALPMSVYPESDHTFTLRFSPTEPKLYSATAYFHGPFVGTIAVPLEAIGYPWVVGPTDAVNVDDSVSVQVYPNPANDVVNVSGMSCITSFELFNTLGEQVLSETLTGNGTVRIAHIASGVYSYRLRSASGISGGKLLIVR